MSRRAEKKRARREEKRRLELERVAVHNMLRNRFPAAMVTWHDRGQLTLRVEGVPRRALDQLEMTLRNSYAHAHELEHARLARHEFIEIEAESEAERLRMTDEGRVGEWFDFLQLLVPKRIADEEIGDALEVIARLVREGRPKWQIYLKAASAGFFVLLNTVREISGSLLGKKNKA